MNASPVVPCFHGGTFHYKTINVYDDHDEDIAQYFPETNTFIEQVCMATCSGRGQLAGATRRRRASPCAQHHVQRHAPLPGTAALVS